MRAMRAPLRLVSNTTSMVFSGISPVKSSTPRMPGAPAQAVFSTLLSVENTVTSTRLFSDAYWAKAAAVSSSSMRKPARAFFSRRVIYSDRAMRAPSSSTVRSPATSRTRVAGRRSPAATAAALSPLFSATTVGAITRSVTGS